MSPRALLPFPPLPALVLLPFVAIWGLAVNDQAIFIVLAGVDVALCWWAIGRLPVSVVVRLATTIFFAFGTVFWFTAQIRTTWYQAHIVAVGLTFLSIGIVLGADPEAAEDEPDGPDDEPPDEDAQRQARRRPVPRRAAPMACGPAASVSRPRRA